MDDFDKMVLAVQGGNLTDFCNAPGRTGELLIHTAGRLGKVGYKMMALLLGLAQDIPNDLYLTACKRAIDISYADRVQIMANQAEICKAENDLSIYVDKISYALSGHKMHIAEEILDSCTPQMLEAANPMMLV